MGLFDIFKKKKNTETNENEQFTNTENLNGDTAEPSEFTDESEIISETAETKNENAPIKESDILTERNATEDVVADPVDVDIIEIAEKNNENNEISENGFSAEANTAQNQNGLDSAETSNPDLESFGNSVIEEYDEYEEKPKEKISFFSRLKKGLQKTRSDFSGKMASVFTFGRKIDDDFYDELEEILIQSDVGVRTAMELTDRLRERQKAEKIKDTDVLQKALEEEIENILLAKDENENRIVIEDDKLNIILVVGVNGAGKTTTIGKMAHYYKSNGKKVLLAAADTFRAAAIEQLCEWGERVKVPVIRQSDGSDPGAVVFDACQAAKSRKTDVLIVDTAGRLQNKKNLMEELKKINKIIGREAPNSNVECLLVLDSGTGQNAISQAKLFGEVVPLTGIILTKLDGTAKGGVVIGITNELSLPVKMIGVGESMDDLREFVPADFAKALFEADNT